MTNCREVTGDGMDSTPQHRIFDRDTVTWLAGEGIRYLHAADEREEIAYRRTVELLQKMPEATAAIGQAFHDVPHDDYSLRWALLYLLAEMNDVSAAKVFYKAAAEPVPSRDRYPQGCETPRDGEVFVRTMAIAGLARVGARDKGVIDLLYRLLEAQPERALRIETVKALRSLDPNSIERIRNALPEELQFAVDITQVRAEALAVEHENKLADATRFAPELGKKASSPRASCCNRPEHC
jgi:hypothetical protein